MKCLEIEKKHTCRLDAFWSSVWVSQRIIPSDRQNIGQILRDNKLKLYDEFELLLLSKGRCEQDNFYISRIEENELPKEITDRRSKRIYNIFLRKDKTMIIFLKNSVIKLCNLSHIDFTNADVQTDGYGVLLNNNMTISYIDLYNNGTTIPLEVSDFIDFIQENVINTTEAMEILNCSRQYINLLVKKNVLHPIKKDDNRAPNKGF